MCGIAGFYLFQPNDKIDQQKLIDALIWGINSRGGDACGFSAFDDRGLLMHEVAAVDAKDFIKGRRAYRGPAQFAICHTRFATQGHQGFMRNNHPVVNGGVHVTHNGHISNDTEIFNKVGWDKRYAEVDTEAIPAIVATHGWENWKDALGHLEGGYAVAMAHEDHPGELILAKGEMSPLVYFFNGRILIWASTPECLLSAWKQCIGKPPLRTKLKHLKFGEAIVIRNGELKLDEFDAKMSNWSTKYSGYLGWDNEGDWDSGYEKCEDGVWREKSKVKSAAESAKVLMPGKTNSGVSIVDLGVHAPAVEALQVEHDMLRRRVDEILALGDDWWQDGMLLTEFNNKWATIREIRDEIEDLTWEAVLEGTDAIIEPDIEIQCPACMQMTPMADMDNRPGIDAELYCSDCLEQWDSLNTDD